MNRAPTLFLQAVIVLIGIGVLTFLLVEPHFEGRNVNATLFEIYFKDPFLAYAYIASIPFFIALVQAFKVLGYAGRHEVLSLRLLNAIRTIKFCAMSIIGFVALGEVFIMLNPGDDGPPAIMMGILIIFGSLIVIAASTTLERILRSVGER